MKLAVLLAAFAMPTLTFGQGNGSFADAMKKGAEARLARAQTEQIEAQTRQMELQTVAAARAELVSNLRELGCPAAGKPVHGELDKAIQALVGRYPGMLVSSPRMIAISKKLLRGDLDWERYIVSLYVLAKFEEDSKLVETLQKSWAKQDRHSFPKIGDLPPAPKL